MSGQRPASFGLFFENLPSLDEMIYNIVEQNDVSDLSIAIYSPWHDELVDDFLKEDEEYAEDYGMDKYTPPVAKIPLSSYVLKDKPFEKLGEILLQDYAWGFCSDVKILSFSNLVHTHGKTKGIKEDGGNRHLIHLDFQCDKSEEALKEVADAIYYTLEIESGFILDSGRSYHFWGDKLMRPGEWKNFMEFIKEVPSIGEHWPGFQLERGYSVLRFSKSSYHPERPVVIARLEGDKRQGTLFKEKP